MWVGPPSGQACGSWWQGHEFSTLAPETLAVRAALADGPGDQQQDQEYAERKDSEGPGRDRQFALGLKKRQCQGHTRSVAAHGIRWVTEPLWRGTLRRPTGGSDQSRSQRT